VCIVERNSRESSKYSWFNKRIRISDSSRNDFLFFPVTITSRFMMLVGLSIFFYLWAYSGMKVDYARTPHIKSLANTYLSTFILVLLRFLPGWVGIGSRESIQKFLVFSLGFLTFILTFCAVFSEGGSSTREVFFALSFNFGIIEEWNLRKVNSILATLGF